MILYCHLQACPSFLHLKACPHSPFFLLPIPPCLQSSAQWYSLSVIPTFRWLCNPPLHDYGSTKVVVLPCWAMTLLSGTLLPPSYPFCPRVLRAVFLQYSFSQGRLWGLCVSSFPLIPSHRLGQTHGLDANNDNRYSSLRARYCSDTWPSCPAALILISHCTGKGKALFQMLLMDDETEAQRVQGMDPASAL